MTAAWYIFSQIAAVIVLLELAIAVPFIFASLRMNSDARRARRRKP